MERNELELPLEVELRGPTEEEARIARARRTVLALPAAALTEEEEEEERVQREVEEMLHEDGVSLVYLSLGLRMPVDFSSVPRPPPVYAWWTAESHTHPFRAYVCTLVVLHHHRHGRDRQ